MKTSELPAAVRELIYAGIQEQDAAKRDADAAARQAREARERFERETRNAICDAVLAAGVGLTSDLVGYLDVAGIDAAHLAANNYLTVNLSLPGCSRVSFNVTHGPDGWVIRRDRDGPFMGGRPGYTGSHPFATLPLAVAAARDHWIYNQPVPAGIS